jgi:hypothetical protein
VCVKLLARDNPGELGVHGRGRHGHRDTHQRQAGRRTGQARPRRPDRDAAASGHPAGPGNDPRRRRPGEPLVRRGQAPGLS